MKKNGYTLIELMVALGIICIMALIPAMALWTDSSIEWWIYYFKHETINIPYWMSLIITIIGNWVILFFNVITELFKLILQ